MSLAADEANLLSRPQPCLDHDHLFVESDNRHVTLLPHRHGCLHPMAEGNTLHLDLFCDHGLVDDLIVLVDYGVHAHTIGQSVALADDGLLLDHWNNLAVVVELVGWLLHVHPDVGPKSTLAISAYGALHKNNREGFTYKCCGPRLA